MIKLDTIAQWAKDCPGIGELDISRTEPGANGIYRLPARNITKFSDGSQLVTESYNVLFNRPTKLKAQRIKDDELLEIVAEWIRECELSEHYPAENVQEIALTNAAYLSFENDAEAVYQITISMIYLEDN